ncbi:MAG: sel1 repeat family protein [Candidatus Adiutrix sp.]|nr:sel1 repeat family protein [Candidatus Adiutrix sp.]
MLKIFKTVAAAALIVGLSLPAARAFCAPEAAAEAAPAEVSDDGSKTVSVTPQEAFQILLKAAEEGQPQAMLNIGAFYENGLGVVRNYSKALQWYARAGEAGLAEGLYNVGVCYEVGMGAAADMPTSVKYFEKAAEKKMPQALYKLASLYLAGNGVIADNAAAVKYLTEAAETGHPVAANDLGVIYLNGLAGQKKDDKKALEFMDRAAELGNAEAMKNIAVMYKDGLGRPADKGNALKWYVLARKAGYQADNIESLTDELKKEMSADQIKKAESAAETWWTERTAKAQAEAAKKAEAK